MALAAEIALYLQTAGIGTVGTTIFRRELPATPVVAIAVLTPPVSDGTIRTFGPDGSLPVADQPRFEVVVRDTDKATAFATARRIRFALDDKSGTLTNPDYSVSSPDGSTATTRYLAIFAVGEPFEREADKPATFEVVQRFSAMKARS